MAKKAEPARLAGALTQKAHVQRDQGDVAGALTTLATAVRLEELVPGLPFAARAELGITLAKKGDDARAEVELKEVISRATRVGGALPWESLFHLGALAHKAGRIDEAQGRLEQSVLQIEKGEVTLGDDKARARYRADKADAYQLLIKILLGKGQVEAALHLLERAKTTELKDAGVAAPATQNEALLTELSAQEGKLKELLSAEQAKPAATQDLEKIARLDGLLIDVQKRRASFIEELDRNDALYDRYALRPLQLEKLQQALPAGVLVVSPVIMDDRVVVFAVSRETLTHFVEMTGAGELERTVGAFLDETRPDSLSRGFIKKGVTTTTTTTTTTSASLDAASLGRQQVPARKLYDLLLRKPIAQLGVPKTLVVSASGILRYVPFSALLDGDKWVVEGMDVVHMTALNRDMGGGQMAAGKIPSVLAFADPDGSLPGALSEVASLKTQLKDAMIFDGKLATAASLRSKVASPGYDIVHLATHGRLDAKNPQQSHILFADRDLTYGDIPTLPFKHTKLVVLSACDTAVASGGGKVGGTGVEIAGLAYQFQRTRVDAVLASLWPVDDAATAELMASFYGRVREGKTWAQALGDAERTALKKRAHPALWAPFILLGTP